VRTSLDILLVEDDPASRRLIRAVLHRHHYRIAEAEDLAQAQHLLAHTLPRLVLLDLRLGEGNGLELVERIRSEPYLAHIPIIVITAQAMQRDEDRVLRAGVDAYVSKPIDTRRLPLLVDELMHKGRGVRHA
jgi:two-component system cell cycle response regulator DivK